MVLPRWTKGTAAPSALPASLALLAGLAPTVAEAAASRPELRILSPRAGDALGSKEINVDISYQSRPGVPVIAAEVWVDGVRWIRYAPEKVQARGVFNFVVDASSLPAGAHTILVKVFDASNAQASKSIEIVAGDDNTPPSGAVGGPELQFVAPKNGKMVSGTVELSVDAKEKDGANPYVTFYIDKQFKTLKNYPPYTYLWDTTKSSNGWHTIEATGYVESSDKTTTHRMRLYVDNAGGNTVRMTDIPDLSAAPPPRPLPTPGAQRAAGAPDKPLTIPLPKPTLPDALTSAPAPKPAPVRIAQAHFSVPPLLPPTRPVTAVPDTTAPAKPSRRISPVMPAPSTTARVSQAVPARKSPAPATPALRTAPLRFAQAAPRFESLPVQAGRTALSLATPGASRAALSLAAPGTSRVATPRTASSAGRIPASLATPRATVRGVAVSAPSAASRAGAIQVAFDGAQIAFDVAPRVEKGLPLAPFRQIFEHTGGVVTWVPGSRVVRAVNAEREITLAIGKHQARVNDQTITLAKPAFIEQGRAIVPLSFIRKALDVDVQYDPATGRLQITSR